ncbi:hypothetical protein SLA2020_332310 [Shorea laevis]
MQNRECMSKSAMGESRDGVVEKVIAKTERLGWCRLWSALRDSSWGRGFWWLLERKKFQAVTNAKAEWRETSTLMSFWAS